MKYILFSLLLVFSSISAMSMMAEKLEKQMIENLILPALQSEHDSDKCNLSLANDCFNTLKEVFAACKLAVDAQGKDINYDITCLKALWKLKNSNMKECLACSCEFAEFIKIKIPFCEKKQMIKESIDLFEQLMAEN